MSRNAELAREAVRGGARPLRRTPMRPIRASRSARRCARRAARIFAGCNVENAAYPEGNLRRAERHRRDGARGRAAHRGNLRRRRRRGALHALRRLPPAHPRIRRRRDPDPRRRPRGRAQRPSAGASCCRNRSGRGICRPEPQAHQCGSQEHSMKRRRRCGGAALKAQGLDFPPPPRHRARLRPRPASPTRRASAVAIPYADIPGFPVPSVAGHAGRLVVGAIEGQRVALFQGRGHYYERGDARRDARRDRDLPPPRRRDAAPHQRRGRPQQGVGPPVARRDHRPHQLRRRQSADRRSRRRPFRAADPGL